MSVDCAHKSPWEIAEVVFGIPFLISIAIHVVIPFSLPQGVFRQLLLPLGIILISMGTAFIVLGRRELAHFNQPTDPGHPTRKVINSGVFAISRNPLYLGSVLVISGLALALNLLWTFVMLLLSILICLYVLIIPEEQYLAAKFGEEYKAYTVGVHRWFGRK